MSGITTCVPRCLRDTFSRNQSSLPVSEPSSRGVPRPASGDPFIPGLLSGLARGLPAAAASSAANAAATVPARGRRRLGADFVVGETGTKDSDTKPFVLSCSSMPRAMSAAVPPNAEMRGVSLSEGGNVGSLVLMALGRARRARRPILSPFRNFSSKVSRAAVSSASCARESAVAFFRFNFASSATRLLFSSASFSSAAVLFSI